MIFTFYSFKGGVGRSMALANVAELLYLAGLKVLMIDWDLEAPGLERFFDVDANKVLDHPGLLDLLLFSKQKIETKKLDENDESLIVDIKKYVIDLYPQNISEGKLWMISAGKRSGDHFQKYASDVINFNWKDFYAVKRGLFYEWLIIKLREFADVVLIDSRTGINEMNGPCTYQIADVVVMLCSSNWQNLEGTKKMLNKFKNPRLNQSREYPLKTLVIPARIDENEGEALDNFQKEFQKIFSEYTPNELHQKKFTLWELMIPYAARCSYQENLVIQDSIKPHAEKLVKAYSKLTSALSLISDENSIIKQKLPNKLIEFDDGTYYGTKVRDDIFVILGKDAYVEKQEFTPSIDLGYAAQKSIFIGRNNERRKLKKWIVNDRCRLVGILGMGGIGKTDLSLEFVRKDIADEFEYVIWTSLEGAPHINVILDRLLAFLSNQKYVDHSNQNIHQKITELIEYLSSHRCLLILDNLEAILKPGEPTSKEGQYLVNRHEYAHLFKAIGESEHRSCLMLTSREIPLGISQLAGETLRTRILDLHGLDHKEGQKFCKSICSSLKGNDDHWKKLIEFYNGNALALRLAALCIDSVYLGDISKFLDADVPIFDDLKKLLDWHLSRLSESEIDIMYWLAINHEPITASELQSDIIDDKKSGRLPFNIQSLQRRFPLEERSGFTLQPVIKEYLIEELIDEVFHELIENKINKFHKYVLVKATAKDYIRETQERLILCPTNDKLLSHFQTKERLIEQIRNTLTDLKQSPHLKSGYAGGNILNLLCYLEVDLTGYDFSEMKICQAYLQGKDLHRVNFSQSDLSKSIFTEAFASILAVTFNPVHPQFLATGDADGGIRIWQVGNLQQADQVEAHSSWVRSISFSPDGQFLASGSDDQLVKLWNFSDGKVSEEPIQILRGHTYRIRSVSFSPDGKFLASSSFDKTIKLWNPTTGECIHTFKGHKDWVWTATFNRDGTHLVSSSQDKTLKIWDVKSGSCIQTLNIGEQIQSIAFSFDGKLMAAGSDDATVKLWKLEGKTYQFPKSLEGHVDFVRSLAFNREGKLASASYDNTVRLWDVERGKCIKVFRGHTHRLRAIAFSPDDKTIVSGGWDHQLKIWNIDEGNDSLRSLQGKTYWICSADISPDGEFVVSGSDDKTLKLWNVESGKIIKTFTGHDNWVWTVAFSPDGKLLASGSFDKTVRLWNIHSGECLHTLKGHVNWVWAVAFSPDRKYLVSGSDDKAVKMWDVKTGEMLKEFKNKDSKWVRSVAFSPNSDLIASGSDDSKIRIWDVETEKANFLEGHSDRVRSVAFSPDGKTLASASYDKTVKIWDITSQKCLHTLDGHTEKVRSVSYSHKGDLLASGGNDRVIRLWNTENGECIQELSEHTDEVRSVSFGRNCDTLVSSSKDGTIRLWNPTITDKSTKCLRQPRLYEGMVIADVKGLTDSQKLSLKRLGATE